MRKDDSLQASFLPHVILCRFANGVCLITVPLCLLPLGLSERKGGVMNISALTISILPYG